MPFFIVHVRQFIEEIGEITVEADDEDAAENMVSSGDDIDWSDGDETKDFHVVKVDPVDDPDNELGGHLDKDENDEDEEDKDDKEI